MTVPIVSPTSLQTLSKSARRTMRLLSRDQPSWEIMWWGVASTLTALLAALAGIILQRELGQNPISAGLGLIFCIASLLGAGLALWGFFLPLGLMLSLHFSGEDPQAAKADAKRTALLGWAGALASSHAILDMEAAKRSVGSEIVRTERRKSIQTLLAALTAGIVALAKVGKFDTEVWGEILVLVSAGLSAGATLGLLAMFGYVERLHFISEAVEEAILRLQTANSVKIP